MNSIKNLMILAVLSAVGYGVYVSLSRNNVEPCPPFGATKGDPLTLKPSTPHGGPLALGGSASVSAKPTATEGGKPVSAPSLAPPSAPPLAPASPPPAAGSGATLGVPVPQTGGGEAAAPDPLRPLPPQNPMPGAVRNIEPPPSAVSSVGAAVSDPLPVRPENPVRAESSALQTEFARFMEAVQKTLDQGKLAEAQLALSKLYGNPHLPPELARQITDLLDQLAGTVIYSRQHLLGPPYVVEPGDTLEKIAAKYDVPWQLLARINGLMPPAASIADESAKNRPLPPGMELKVVQGPFDAEIQLGKRELTLKVHERYAGRFPIGIGRDPPKLEGNYTVRGKTLSPAYYGPDGVTIAPNDPKNPLGGAWIELTDRIGIHGAAEAKCIGRDDNRGAICVGDRDLEDLYGILSVGSRVTIVR